MDALAAHANAAKSFSNVLDKLNDNDLSAATPCAEWNVKQIIEHAIRGNLVVSGSDLKIGDTLNDLKINFKDSANKAIDEFSSSDSMDKEYKLPFGPVKGSTFICMRTNDLLIHSWDIARATGQRIDFDQESVTFAFDFARSFVQDTFRGPGKPFGHAKPVDPKSQLIDQLAAFLGRDI